ncbi:MAG TPA: sialate O-acetylesterase, partial [Chitinophagaceae bacterium]|nr:sialate O-acetylesterase [Chitinophagaceae bacterium]
KCDMATAVGPNRYPTLLYNAMIHPIVGFPVTGVIWYQGESNAGRAMQYRTAFPLMIRDWRKQWKSELPFYFVQLANFGASGGTSGNGGSEWAELRESQAATLRLPNTGMAVIIDIGESKDIHPRNKQDVGKRLAANALANTYRKKMEYTGPVFKSMKIEGNKAILSFDHAAELEVRPASDLVNGFEIAGADQRFYQATARIEGNRIVVSAPEVTKPAAVRYAWADDPQNLNLYNKAGFPAAPFRTDTWKARTEGVKFSFE